MTRGLVYKHLAEAFSYPRDAAHMAELIDHLKHDLYRSGLFSDAEKSDIISCLDFPLDINSLALEYTRLFRGPVRALIYPYESMYFEGEVFGQTTLDVIKKYAEAGLQISHDFKDLPDHICAELEFMYYLCNRADKAILNSSIEGSLRILELQRGFFDTHINRWAPEFCRKVEQHTSEQFYKGISLMLAAFLHLEREQVITPKIDLLFSSFPLR